MQTSSSRSRKQSSKERPGQTRPREAPLFEPGRLLMLPDEVTCTDDGWVRQRDNFPHRGIFGHPVVMIQEREHEVLVLVMSTLNNHQDFASKDGYTRIQHIPIWPCEPHPDKGELLLIDGETDKPSCVKVHEKYWFPKQIFRPNTDRFTGKQLKLGSSSVDYLNRAVHEFKGKFNGYLSRSEQEDPKFNSSRPFYDIPFVVSGTVKYEPSVQTSPNTTSHRSNGNLQGIAGTQLAYRPIPSTNLLPRKPRSPVSSNNQQSAGPLWPTPGPSRSSSCQYPQDRFPFYTSLGAPWQQPEKTKSSPQRARNQAGRLGRFPPAPSHYSVTTTSSPLRASPIALLSHDQFQPLKNQKSTR